MLKLAALLGRLVFAICLSVATLALCQLARDLGGTELTVTAVASCFVGCRILDLISQQHRNARERVRCGFPWLVDADIRSFFDEIPHRPLLKRFDAWFNDKTMRNLLTLWLECFASPRSLFQPPRGIPQGAVVSPFLCNLYLHSADSDWQRQRIPFVRYADDFLLFATSDATAARALEQTRNHLDGLGLALHDGKTQVIRSSGLVTFLGERMPDPPKQS